MSNEEHHTLLHSIFLPDINTHGTTKYQMKSMNYLSTGAQWARAKAFTFVKFTKKSCKCFSISPLENAKAFTKSIQHLQNFVNALAFSGLEMLKHLQNSLQHLQLFVNALAFSGLEMLKHLQKSYSIYSFCKCFSIFWLGNAKAFTKKILL